MEILKDFLPVTQEEKNVLYKRVFKLDWSQAPGGLFNNGFRSEINRSIKREIYESHFSVIRYLQGDQTHFARRVK